MPILVGLPLLVLIAVFVSLGIAATQRSVSSGVVGFLSQAIQRFGGSIGIAVELEVRLTRWVTHHVYKAFGQAEHLVAGWLGALTAWAGIIGGSALWPTIALGRFLVWMLDHEIPRLIRAVPSGATKIVHSVTSRVVRIERTVVKFPKLSRAQARALITAAVATYIGPYLSPLRWLRAHFHALTAVLPHAIPIQWGRTVTALRKRLRRLERLTAAGAAVGAVALALSRLGLNWVKCHKVGRIGRQVCGMDDRFLDTLLLDAVGIFSIISVVEFATELRTIEDEAVSIMGRLVREWPT